MRRKNFMLALVAMLSFTFSAFAQTTVTTEAELKTILTSSGGGSVTLGDDITLTSNVTTKRNAVITLDLNGHTITASSTKISFSLAVGAELTIKDSGENGEIIDVYWNCNPSSVLTLKAGTLKREGRLVYTSGAIVVDGGTLDNTGSTIVNATNSSVELAGSGSLTVNGGSVGSVYLKSDSKVTVTDGTISLGANLQNNSSLDVQGGTINSVSLNSTGNSVISGGEIANVTVADGFSGTLSISGGTFDNPDAVKDYLEDGLVIENGQVVPALTGDGTEANPYTIGNLTQLKEFRDEVNAGNNYQGKFVKLTADIDLNNEEWTPIGNVTYDSKYKPTDASKVFSGVFNGNGKVISNLKVSSTVGGADTQANVGLFGITGEGAVIKDLTLTNVNIETDGRNVGAIAGFAYKATLSNITVNGNIQIKGGNNVAGIAGMTRYYAMSATGISVIGNDGSAIVGNNIVGGIFAEIAPNGSEQKFDGLNVENVAITGVGGVGGIVGLLTTGTVENVSVKNVVLTGRTDYQGNAMGRIRLGAVAGLMGGKYATIANEVIDNVTAKNLDGNAVELPVIGANYDAASNATEAKIGNNYYNTFAAAYTAAQAGETVTLLADLNMSEILVLDKAITLDGNDKKLTSTAGRAINVSGTDGVTIKNLIINASGERAINVIQNATNVTIDNVTATAANYTVNLASSAGAAKVAITGSNLTGLNVVNVGAPGSEITINGGTITCNDQNANENYAALAMNKDAVGAKIAAIGVTFDIKGDSKKAKNGAEDGVITIDGSTDGVDVNVAYIKSEGDYYYAFTSIEAAIEAANAGQTICLIRDITAFDIITINKAITIDLNGKTITGTDNTSKNFSIIDNRGTLTIKDSSADKTGKITLTATTNSGWNRYSAVIANNPGGKLTVESGTIEHLGGTDMAYGIDNLTNGKGTYAETIINGGTIKSTYRGIRQFLNGTEAQNILTINGGTIEGANKSVWMQDPSKNANTGTLTIAENAKLVGDVYLFVTAGSTEWPVSVSIAAAALQGESKVTTGNVPSGYDFAEVNGTYGVFSGAAKIGTTYYETVTAAINAAADGATVQLLSGTIDEYIAPWAGDTQHKTEKSITIVGAENFGTTLTGGLYLGYDDSQCRDHNIVVKGIAFEGKGVLVASQKNVTIEGNKFSNITDCVASPSTASKNAISINGKDVNAVVKNNIITTTASVGIDLRNIKTAEVEGNTVANTQHNSMQVQNASAESKVEVLNNNFSDWGLGGEGRAMRINVAKDVTVNGNVMSYTGTAPEEFAKVTGATALDASKNYWNGLSPLAAGMFAGVEGDPANVLLSYYTDVDKTELVTFSASVATIGNVYYQTLAEAVEAAANGDVVTLISDVTMDAKQYVTQNDGYAVLVNAKDKNVTVDLNSKTVAVDVEAADLDGAAGKMLLAVFHADLNGALTLVDNSADKAGKVIVNANEDAKVYSLGASESGVSDKSQNGTLTINGGTYIINKVNDSMFFTDADGKIVINGGTFELGNIATGANGSPWIFNTYGKNGRQVIVNGGTFNADVNHQFWANEVFVPGTKAFKDNGDGTWTTVDAVAYTEELATSTNAYSRMIGYATVEEAMAATGKYNCIDNAVALVGDLEIENSIVVPSDVTVVLDLNGKVLSMNDASGKGAYAIKNQGNLTIADNSEAKTGKITFNSTTPDNSFGYATSTIGNAGQLTVNSGTIENTTVGGASYAIDGIWHTGDVSLTINGGTIVANKIAVRQVPFSATAKNVVTVKGGTLTGATAGLQLFNINNDAKLAEVNIHGGVFNGTYAFYTSFTSAAASDDVTINIDGGEFNGYLYLYNGNNGSHEYPMTVSVTGGTFNGGAYIYTKDANGAEVAIRSIAGGTFANNVDEYCAAGYICKANEDGTYGIVENPAYGKVAQIGSGDIHANQYFATLNEAAQAAKTGDVIKLIADVNISAAGYATVDEENQYSTMMAVKEKDITLDMNGKTITVTPTADELADAEMQMLMSVFGMDTNGKLTITGNGTVKVVANDAQVYSIVTAYGEGSQVTIENGNFEADKLMLSGSLFYSQQSECIIVNGGNFSLGNLADPEGQNGQPWIFNTKGQNYTGAIVNGGTFPTDINHQFWAHEVRVPETNALKANEDGTWTVVPSVAYTTEKASSRGSYFRNIGYASIEDAIAATDKYNCQNNTVTLIKDIAIETEVKIANGTTVVLDLNGKTIAGTDKGTASFGLITNKGDLTITDSSEEATGKITLTAEQNRGWSAYSSVISNTVGGKLTVNGGTIQHFGGTSMAWGIDNLTNGKGTYAETEINGGLVNSAYIAIRQFLNGVEAQNILTVNDGTLQGGTASLYFQDPSKNANTGTLDVFEDATLAGDVYLDVTEGSTEWPVEVYITKAALGEYEIHTENIPEDAAALVEYAEFWLVEQKNLAELTIVDEDYAEYINKVEKNVEVLTYVREFDENWQTLYLPFEVPVANLMNDFDVAYIYNAGYKNSTATLDYVVIEDANFVLAANYPYLIRAKETGEKSIVVENAKLMPTEINTIDCSSVFEKFVFAGNYSTLDASTLDAKKGYFDMNAGNWSRMDVLNPFRVYMQIELRNGNGSDFVYPTESQKIRMRRVDENGEASGIDEVDAEHGVDYIFDLHGRRVAEPQKGQLYIINGKKVVF